MLVMDSIGLGIFTVVGVNTGINNGYMDHTFLLVFLGTITGVGGGLLRDMMAGVPPYIFVRHVYACARSHGSENHSRFSEEGLQPERRPYSYRY